MRFLIRYPTTYPDRAPSACGARPGPRAARPRLGLMILGVLLLLTTSCSLRTYPPIRYIPLLGTEKKVTTTSVLAQALKDRDVSVRAQAVKLLGILSQDSKEKVVKEVAQVLGMAMKDRDPGIRIQVIEVLGRMDEKVQQQISPVRGQRPQPLCQRKSPAGTRDPRKDECSAASPGRGSDSRCSGPESLEAVAGFFFAQVLIRSNLDVHGFEYVHHGRPLEVVHCLDQI